MSHETRKSVWVVVPADAKNPIDYLIWSKDRDKAFPTAQEAFDAAGTYDEALDWDIMRMDITMACEGSVMASICPLCAQ